MEPRWLEIQQLLEAVPDILNYLPWLWAAICLAGAIRAWRHRWKTKTGASHAIFIDIFKWLVWGGLPLILVPALLDRAMNSARWPSIGLGFSWLILTLPAFLIPAGHRRARSIKIISLIAGDVFGVLFLMRAIFTVGHEPRVAMIIIFILFLHLAAVSGGWTAGRTHASTRWFILLSIVFLCSSFFRSPAESAERIERFHGPVLQVLRHPRAVMGAVVDSEGDAAWVIYKDAPHRMFRVRLADGQTIEQNRLDEGKYVALTIEPQRRVLVAALQRASTKEIVVYLTDPFQELGRFTGGQPMEIHSLAVMQNLVAAAGQGRQANSIFCNLGKARNSGDWKISSMCRELAAPVPRIGSLLLAPQFGFAIAAEGNLGFAPGRRLVNFNTYDIRMQGIEPIGPSVGGMAVDLPKYLFYLARPAAGTIEVRNLETLSLGQTWPMEGGVAQLALDRENNLLLGISPVTGNLVVLDLLSRKVAARVPIGLDLVSLDYHAATATALIGARRGPVTVKIRALPGVPGSYSK